MPKTAKLARELRISKGLTQAKVAEKLGVSQASYSVIERGKKPAAVHSAIRTINKMRTRTDRTDGGSSRVGRIKV